MTTPTRTTIYMFMAAEFARHAGHGDILREQIEADGDLSAAPKRST
nr:DUF664 domain-containing protein [Nocardia higoensis]